MENNKVTLKYSIPVKIKDDKEVEVTELKLDRIKVKHMKLLPDSFMEAEGKISPIDAMPVIAALAGIPVEAAEEIDLEDLENLMEVLLNFLPSGQPNGEKSSGP